MNPLNLDHHHLVGDIDPVSVQGAIDWIEVNSPPKNQNPPNALSLLISSPGGDIPSAIELINAMHSTPIPIRTIGLGLVASSATLIFVEGEMGERILTEDVEFTTHIPLITTSENITSTAASDIKKRLDIRYEQFKKIYSDRSRGSVLSDKTIQKKMLVPDEATFTAREVEYFGLADKIANSDYIDSLAK